MYNEIERLLKVRGLINQEKFAEYMQKEVKEIRDLIYVNRFDEAVFAIIMNIGEKIKIEDLFEFMEECGFIEYKNESSGIWFECTFICTYKNLKIKIQGLKHKDKLEDIFIRENNYLS